MEVSAEDCRARSSTGLQGMARQRSTPERNGPSKRFGKITMVTVTIQIKGVTALLQHRFTEAAEVPGETRRMLVTRGTPREEAAKCAHQRKDGTFFFPGSAILRMLREVASGHKLKGSRKSAKFIVPGAVVVLEDDITLLNGDGSPVKDFEVDSRPVTIPSTKGKIMRHRPRFDQWSAKFQIRINENILPVDFIHRLMDEAGEVNGLGDFRPQTGGPFGRFVLTSWKEK